MKDTEIYTATEGFAYGKDTIKKGDDLKLDKRNSTNLLSRGLVVAGKVEAPKKPATKTPAKGK